MKPSEITSKLVVLSAALCLALGAGHVALAQVQTDIVAAARQEGSVTWYTNPGFRQPMKEAIEEWGRRYPQIELKIVEATGADVAERVRAERSAGKVTADVVTLGDTVAYSLAASKALIPLERAKLANFANVIPRLAAFANLENGYLPTLLFAYGINVNTRHLSEAEIPHSWSDLANPRYAGKIGVPDFGRPGGANTWMTIGMQPLGQEFFKGLMKQKPRVFSSPQELDAAVVRGERAIAAPSRTRVAKDYAGAPIRFILPQDGIFVVVMQSGIVNGSTHPNAAYLLLNFLLDPVAQRAIAAVGDVPVIQGVTTPVDFATAKFLGEGRITPAEMPRQKEVMEFGKTLMQR